jgi:hypothetical protein
MKFANDQRQQVFREVPLSDVPHHFAGMRQSPYTQEYLSAVLQWCPPGARTFEAGFGDGYGAIWLSLRGVLAEGIETSEPVVERARQVNGILGGNARFHRGDAFQLYAACRARNLPRWQVIHHQGFLEHFSRPYIRAALAQQVACAHRVVFSVPSVYYPFEPESGDERLLPLEEWHQILEPFNILELRLYGILSMGRGSMCSACWPGRRSRTTCWAS